MNSIIKDCTGVILAGGENIRMPVLKAFIEVNGEKVIERNLKIMRQLFKETFIVTNQPELYFYLETPLLGDVYNVRGPMTGVFTSLLNSSSKWVFISACDMPFIDKELIKYMASKRDNYDAVLPKYNETLMLQDNESNPHKSPFSKGGLRGIVTNGVLKGDYAQPLFAFYSKCLMISMERALFTDQRGLKVFLGDKKITFIETKDLNNIDNAGKSFVNLNTPKDIYRELGKKYIIKQKPETGG